MRQQSTAEVHFSDTDEEIQAPLKPSIRTLLGGSRPGTAEYAMKNDVETGRPFLQEFRDDSVSGEIRCVAWHPTEMWLAVAAGWEKEDSEENTDDPEKAYVLIWDLTETSLEDTSGASEGGGDDFDDENYFEGLFADTGFDVVDVLSPEKSSRQPLLSVPENTNVWNGEEEKDATSLGSLQVESVNSCDVENTKPKPLDAEKLTPAQRPAAGVFASTVEMVSSREKGRLRQKFKGKSAWNSVAWSPSGDKLALCAEKPDEDPAAVFVWRKEDVQASYLTEPTILHELHNGDVKVVAFCNEGTRLASAAWDNTVIVYWIDQPEGTHQTYMVKNFSYGIFSISWAPNLWPLSQKQDIIAVGSEDLDIILWQVPKDFKDKAEFEDKLRNPEDSTPRDSLRLAEASKAGLGDASKAYKNWQRFARGKMHRVLIQGHEGSITSVSWHPTKPILASGSWDNTIAVWDVSLIFEGHNDCLFLEGHSRNVTCVSWNCAGDLLASGSDDHTIVIWVVETATKLQVLESHEGPVLYIQWHPYHDYALASGSKDQYTQTIVWNHKAMEKPINLPTDDAMCLSKRGSVLGKSISGMMSGRTMKLCHVRWSSSGRRIAYASQEEIFFWDMLSSEKEIPPQSMQKKSHWKIAAITWIPFLKRDFLAIGKLDLDKSEWHVEVLDTHKFVVVKDFLVSPRPARYAKNGTSFIEAQAGHQHEIRDIAFTDDCELFATGGNDEDIFIWNYSSSKLVKVLTQHSDWVRCLSFCPKKSNGEWWLASASDDSCVIIWMIRFGTNPERRDGSRRKYSLFKAIKLEGHRGAVFSVTWGPNNAVASGSFDKTIAIWELDKLKLRSANELRQLGSHCSWKTAFAQRDLKQDGIRYLEGHKQEVWDIDWTRDGDTICSCSEDNTVIIWDAVRGKLQQVLSSDSVLPVRSVFWNPHGKSQRLATATLDHEIRLHCILKIPSLNSQKKAAEHLANTRSGRATLAELVRGDLLSLGTKQDGETLAYFLLKSLATSEGKEKISYSKALHVLLKAAIEEEDFFYICKDSEETLPSEKRVSKGLKGLLQAKIMPGVAENISSGGKPISILEMAIRSSDVYAIKAVLEYVTAGLTAPQRDTKRTTLMQSIARENLLDDVVLLLQKFPAQVDEFLTAVGLCAAPLSVLESTEEIDIDYQEQLLFTSPVLCQRAQWKKNWQACDDMQKGILSRFFRMKKKYREYLQVQPDKEEDVLKPSLQAVMTGFPNCLSDRFLTAMMASKKLETLFRVPMIRLIYEYKWTKYKAVFQARFFLYVVYLCCLTIHLLKMTEDYNWLRTTITSINGYFFTSELFQIGLNFKSYVKDVWNYVDFSSTILTFAFIQFMTESFDDKSSTTLRSVGAVLALLSWIKLLHFCLCSRYLAALIQTILVICADMVSFVIIMAILFIGFGVAFSVLEVYHPFKLTLLSEFGMVLGDFAISDFESSLSGNLAVFLFCCFQISVTIIALNALIAIMGDSFEKAQQDSDNNFHVQRARIVEELDQEHKIWQRILRKLCRFKVKTKREVYLHGLVIQGSKYSLGISKTDKPHSDEWKGRNAKITRHIDARMRKMSVLIDSKIKTLELLLEDNQKRSTSHEELINGRMDKLESLITAALETSVSTLDDKKPSEK